MSRLDQLEESYRCHVAIPLVPGRPLAQRIWFLVYAPEDERRLQNRLTEFEIATTDAGLHWREIDLDGFHVLVNYHRIDHATLNALTYTYLGDWIREQKAAVADDVPGAAERLKSATHLQGRLAAILEGEATLDLFVRWKPLSQQAIGWHPDLNDGIRLNIRPFLLAGDLGAKGTGLFRTEPGIAIDPDKADRGTEPLRAKEEYPWFWCDKPPGTDPTGGKEYAGRRWNGVHLTLAKKREATK